MRLHSILLTAPAAALLLIAPAALAQTPPPADSSTTPIQVVRPASMGRSLGMGAMPRSTDAVAPWANQLFSGLDANADGAVTGDELAILSREPIASMGGGRLRAMVSQSDANRDARVSLEEFGAGALRVFTRMDADGDGRLSDEELPPPAAPPRPMSIPMPPPANPMPMPMPDGSGG